MKSALPKQFLLLDGRPLLMHTIERFSTFDSSITIIVVLPAEYHALWQRLCDDHAFAVSHRIVAGGEERFHSVRAGLACVAEDQIHATSDDSGADAGTPGVEEAGPVAAGDGAGTGMSGGEGTRPVTAGDTLRTDSATVTDDILIAIHDGVRPLVSHDTIWRCFADAEEFGNAVPFIEPADSVRVLQGDDSRPLPRNEVRLIQTPQVFRGSVIMKAYRRNFNPAFTDDATVAEADGVKIHLTHGNRENLKITTPEDLAVAATLYGMIRQ
ncbi:MAG: 2-C-methyl-D-erythritol 4-phosphate cytidylyltransferase [Bacteroidales bacterium]|nr:2-C-methyl-D-erythritol 4-phosphate cytidylyltransferase [Bacteroidales bacterium]